MPYTDVSVEQRGPGRLLSVKLPVFEGPLDLLLHLIERQELDISAVSLVLVVDQYLQYLSLMRGEMKLDAAAEFLVVAAKLLLIKSRSLLPQPDPPPPPDEDDPAEELARQLEEYRHFKAIANDLRLLRADRGQMFARAPEPWEVPPTVAFSGLDVDRLIASFQAVLNRKLAEDRPAELSVVRVTQADREAAIARGLSSARSMTLDQLLDDCRTVFDVIVTFLTLLELLKQQRIRLWQGAAFGRIIISRPLAKAHG